MGQTLTVSNFEFTDDELVELKFWLPNQDYHFDRPVEASRANEDRGHINAVILPIYPDNRPGTSMSAQTTKETDPMELDLGNLDTTTYNLGREQDHYRRKNDECLIIMLHEYPIEEATIQCIFDNLYSYYDQVIVRGPFVVELEEEVVISKEGTRGSPKKAGISIVTK